VNQLLDLSPELGGRFGAKLVAAVAWSVTRVLPQGCLAPNSGRLPRVGLRAINHAGQSGRSN
jgi:hypothetical protein